MTIFWPLSRQQVLDQNGRPRLDLRAQFFDAGTTTPRAVFADAALATPLGQPVTCDASGRFPRVFLSPGLYRERVFSVTAGDLWNDDGLGLPAPEEEPVDPTPQIPANAYAITGDTMWRMDGLIRSGWVRMNGGTIGNAASGASERGDADTAGLFSYLFTTFADDLAPVIGGRGASASADFAAGKRITVPSMRGLLQGGLDSMGVGSAGTIQTIASLDLTAGSATATVTTPDRIVPGMLIFASGVNAGTTVVSLSGTTLTMSGAAAAGSTGTVTARFALFDAERPGSVGGDWLRTIINANLPQNLPQGSATIDPAAISYEKYTTLQTLSFGDGGTGSSAAEIWQGATPVTVDPAASTLAVSISNPGGGRPLPQLPPMRVGTFYMKL
ncbi:hypothetical protein PUR23_01215 [Methylorubrum populi]|uniref:hypothetical protein n=1 Tax=Methylorubrum populi TaxID=223967 RepID=UPI0031F7BF5E